jgi:cyclin-dependent kinase regulatory subunit CKS1
VAVEGSTSTTVCNCSSTDLAMANANGEKQVKVEKKIKIEDLIDKIHYSDRYADDEHEYRHVILPKPLYKLIPKQCFVLDEKGKSTGILRLLSEDEWRGIGIKQSMGWVHYEVHVPEPHVLLFRRRLDYVPEVPIQHLQHHQHQQQHGRPKEGRMK